MRNPNLLYDFWILFRKYYKIFGFWPEIITVNVTGADICLRSRKFNILRFIQIGDGIKGSNLYPTQRTVPGV